MVRGAFHLVKNSENSGSGLNEKRFFGSLNWKIPRKSGVPGCLPFVRIIRLGRALINGKGFSKITKPTERNGAYHLQFDFPSLFSADERLETGKFCKW